MYLRTLVLSGIVLTGGCSATVHYQAISYYTENTDGTVQHFDSEEGCAAADERSCTRILLSWETERYCGIYRRADDAVSEEIMRVGKSPFALDGWQLVEYQTMLLGDDEFFTGIDGEATIVESDILCGKFEPPANLLEVRDGDVLNLRVLCKAATQGIKIMPATPTGYPLNVTATTEEKSWLGCRK